MKKIIFLGVLIISSLILAKEKIVCFVPKELRTNKKARMVYEDTNRHSEEELDKNVSETYNAGKTLLEKRAVVFHMKCRYDGDMYNYIMASDYDIDYLTKLKTKGEEGNHYLLTLPTNKAIVFQDMLFIGDLMDNSVGISDKLLLVFYQVNLEFLEQTRKELIKNGFKPVF